MKRLNLCGTWTMSAVSGRESNVPAQVPGDNYTALLTAEKIEDPFYGRNERDTLWVAEEDWVFTRSFDISDDLLSESNVFLVCECIDTFGKITINGVEIGTTENMFRRYRFDVKEALRPGANTITIHIDSPLRRAHEIAEKLPYPIPCSDNPIPGTDTPKSHRNLIRKVQCHAGWDWGPVINCSGISGDIRLESTSIGRIDYVYSTQTHAPGRCEVEVEVEFAAVADSEQELRVTLGDQEDTKAVTLQSGDNKLKAKLVIDNPELWWPNGCGDQPLYDLTVEIGGNKYERKLGLRKMEMISEEDEIGRSLLVRANGRDIFSKGADWIPADALPQRVDDAVLDDLLTSAADANMNMLRIWGGGQYESDKFYELCDEKGLMIWQDFMFSCAMYPANPEYLANVREEAVHQVKRLRDYACIALWCGNNENIGAMSWYKESRENRDRYLVDYDRLNEGVLGKAVDEFDPTRIFWSSSPCGGPGDYQDCWKTDSRGDMHFWDVWHGGKSFNSYVNVRPRFCSEFGFQSFPTMEGIRSFAEESQWNPTSPVMEHHQRSGAGNSKIVEMFTRYFRVPEGFENFVYLSQVQQALAIKTGVEHWRRLRPLCMGAIIWQLNDNWPVASWSTIEYGGKWKLLHYACKQFFAPLLLAATQDDKGDIDICLTSDLAESYPAQVRLRTLDFNGGVIAEDMINVEAVADSAIVVKQANVADFVSDPGGGFLELELTCNGAVFRNTHFFCPQKKCELASANITGTAIATDAGLAVELSTDKPAFYVAVDARGIRGEFDDNCITLLPGESRILTFRPKQDVTIEQFKQALDVHHLRETYR